MVSVFGYSSIATTKADCGTLIPTTNITNITQEKQHKNQKLYQSDEQLVLCT